MHKYQAFEDSTYWSFFTNEGVNALMEILSAPNALAMNHNAWQMDFDIDPETVVHDNQGHAQVRAAMREMSPTMLSDMRAPLGDSLPMEEGVTHFYSAPIAHFTTKHFHETSATMFAKEKQWAEFGEKFSMADRKFINDYMDKLQRLTDEANMTITYLGEQLMTNGYLYYNEGSGIKAGIYKAEIPTKNFRKAGDTAWSDPTVKLMDVLRKLVDDVNTENQVDWKWQLDITKSMWDNYFMKNEQIIEFVTLYKNLSGVVIPSVDFVTTQMVMDMFSAQAGLPKIVIHDTKQYDEHNGVVNGWKSGIATLRPIGRAGLIRHTNPLDTEFFGKKYTNDCVVNNFTPALMGLGYLQNSVYPNGSGKEFRTRYIYTATPTLDEFLYHYIIDTNATE